MKVPNLEKVRIEKKENKKGTERWIPETTTGITCFDIDNIKAPGKQKIIRKNFTK